MNEGHGRKNCAVMVGGTGEPRVERVADRFCPARQGTLATLHRGHGCRRRRQMRMRWNEGRPLHPVLECLARPRACRPGYCSLPRKALESRTGHPPWCENPRPKRAEQDGPQCGGGPLVDAARGLVILDPTLPMCRIPLSPSACAMRAPVSRHGAYGRAHAHVCACVACVCVCARARVYASYASTTPRAAGGGTKQGKAGGKHGIRGSGHALALQPGPGTYMIKAGRRRERDPAGRCSGRDGRSDSHGRLQRAERRQRHTASCRGRRRGKSPKEGQRRDERVLRRGKGGRKEC